MTIPKYGRVTPLQIYMLGLGGEVLHKPALPDCTPLPRMKDS